MHRVRRENRTPGNTFARLSPEFDRAKHLQEELERAKENLNIVVQEMIFTETQLGQRDQEIAELKSKLSKQTEQDHQASVKSLIEKNKILESTLHSKDKVYNEMIDELKRKVDTLQIQLEQKVAAEYQNKAEKVVDRLSVVLQKENMELKKLVAETKDQMTALEQNFAKQAQQFNKEKSALEEQLRVILTNELSYQEKQQLGQSLFGSSQNSEDRLSQSLSITNTVKLLGQSKEKVKYYETENANLRAALVEVGREFELEKANFDRQIIEMQRVIVDLNNQIKESETDTIFEYLEELKKENITLKESLARSQIVKQSSALESERDALQQESKRLDEMMATPQFILSNMLTTDFDRMDEERDFEAERNAVYELQLQNQKLKGDKELLYVRIQDLEYQIAVLENQRLDLQQDVLQLSKQRDHFQMESVLQQRRQSNVETPTKGILKPPTTPEPIPRYSDAVTRVNNLLKKVKK